MDFFEDIEISKTASILERILIDLQTNEISKEEAEKILKEYGIELTKED